MNFKAILILCAGIVLNGCSAQLSGTGTTSAGSHSENPSAYRPKFPTDSASKNTATQKRQAKPQAKQPVLNVNQKVDAVLDSIDELNALKKYIDGYTIQIYSGTNKEEAMNAKKRLANNYYALLQYNQPKFRVTTGAYYTRLEAQKDFIQIKKIFPNCILVPEKVPIR